MAAPSTEIGHLPEVLARFAEAAGLAAALRLAHEIGGTEIYIPAQMAPDHRLAKALGIDDARALVEVFGAGRLLVPLGPSARPEKQRQRIRQLLREGKSRSEIARILRCHMRTVQRLRSEMTAEGQGDLFLGYTPAEKP